MLFFPTVLLGASYAAAHMELVSPPPLRSKYNSQYDWTNIDYSMTNPLSVGNAGINTFPCKGYAGDIGTKSNAVATYTAGQSLTVTLGGTATHGGGSCQFSLSYDGGQTFAVIHSVIGGCPLSSTYTFTIPSTAPAKTNAILSWSWWNKVGNREMYQNCAAVNIVNSNSAASFTGPALFKANIYSDGDCTTREGIEIGFPNPGANLVYGNSTNDVDLQYISGCSSNQIGSVTLGTSGPVTSASSAIPSPSSSSKSSTASSTSPTTSSKATSSTTSSKTTSTTTSSTKTSSSVAPTNTPAGITAGGPCSPNSSLGCSNDGKSFFLCNFEQWTAMGPVAPGTQCVAAQIALANKKREVVPLA